MVTEKNKHLYIVAGPNGSGKTTFVRRFLPYYADCINFVNADLIAAGLSPFLPDNPWLPLHHFILQAKPRG